MRLDGKVVVVTGAAAGIGLATARRLARECARLTLIDLNVGALSAARDAVLADAPRTEVLLVPADVSAEDEVRSAVERTVEDFGRVDGLFNNAGIEGGQDAIEDYDRDRLTEVIDVNLKGVLYGMKHVLPHLKAQGSGAIVNTASVGGMRAVPNLVAYVASKHAVAGMTRAAAIEYGQHGVSVNAVAPGAIMTDMIRGSLIQIGGEEGWEQAGADFVSVNPMRRFGQPDEVATLVAFLLSQEAPFIDGAVVPIDGGQSQAY